MDLPPSHRRRNLCGYGPLLRPPGPIRSLTSGATRRPSPYPSCTNVDARNRTASYPSDDEDFEKSCFNDVYFSNEEKAPSSRNVHFQSTQPSYTPPPSTSLDTKDKASAALDGDEDSMDSEEDDKIPKPNGEVGRPDRGGYNLKIALGWEDDRYDKVKVSTMDAHHLLISHRHQAFINNLVDNHLDGKIPLTEQTSANAQTVRDKVDIFSIALLSLVIAHKSYQAVVKYKFLDEYQDHWATTDFIKTCLKVRKKHWKRRKGRKQVLAEARERKEKKKSAAVVPC